MAVSGKTLVVGADGANAFLGLTHIYVKGASGWPKLPTTTLHDPAQTFYDLFGESVAVAGETVVVGAPGEGASPGVAYVYVKGAAGWPATPTVTLPNPVANANDVFGISVAVSGTTIVVGAGGNSAYIYAKGVTGWSTTPTVTLQDPAATPNDQFGTSVAVSGKTVVVGAYNFNSAAGVTYVYTKGAAGWPTTPTVTLQDPAATGRDYFGNSVAVSGTTIVVGAYGTTPGGAAYIYAKDVTGWPTTPTVTLLAAAYMAPGTPAGGAFGLAAAVSGTTAIISALGYNPGLGTAYIYKA
jgi:hypothetical protein